MIPDLIYCADNALYGQIAIECGHLSGTQLPNKVYLPPYFADQDWRHPNRPAYLEMLRTHQPRLATVLDWEYEEQLCEVLGWAEDAAAFVDCLILIPKVHGGVGRLPRMIGGKPVRLGYSVPTKYAGTDLFLSEFIGWPIHLLGGSPKNQMKLARYLDVRSTDGNYIHHKVAHGQFFDGTRWMQLRDAGINAQGKEIPETILRLSWPAIKQAWAKS